MPNRRLERLNEQFRREITGILNRDVRDPRVLDVVVTGVAVTSDLWLARVYVRFAGEDVDREEAMRGLDAASSFIRRELGSMLHIRRVPELRFLEDETLDQANRIEAILREIGQEERPDPDDPGEASED
jgi:ribosome-binding factor A